ncbi:hypothetical protein Hte_006269 [Hypoxylon texense]
MATRCKSTRRPNGQDTKGTELGKSKQSSCNNDLKENQDQYVASTLLQVRPLTGYSVSLASEASDDSSDDTERSDRSIDQTYSQQKTKPAPWWGSMITPNGMPRPWDAQDDDEWNEWREVHMIPNGDESGSNGNEEEN